VAVDFGKINPRGPRREQVPQAIFRALPARADQYEYLRDVQDQVLTDWYQRRRERDVLIKMNTGGGKTVVGLLALQSSLNEGAGPAVYLTPDKYLAGQVRREADALGLAVTDDPRSPLFRRGESILVVTVAKLFTGRSVFGVDREREPLDIGTMLFDDAHSTVDIVNDRFTMSAADTTALYGQLLSLFEADLGKQSSSGLLALQDHDHATLEPVPFWAWREKLDRVHKILHASRESEELMFHYGLIKEHLGAATCIFGGNRVEIRPLLPAVSALPSFSRCQRRIFMTATLADEGSLVSALGADCRSIGDAITPRSASDLGERLILAPLELNPHLTDRALETFVAGLASRHNVALICPSNRRARRWAPLATDTVTAANLTSVVDRLKNGNEHGLFVFVGKYDGVDLPGNACRVLIIDGLPEATSLHDRLSTLAIARSRLGARRQVQRIEQGMGRGVRSEKDYCAVLLLGEGLTRHVYGAGLDEFSEATRAQLDLSRQVADQLDGKGLEAVEEAIQLVVGRSPEWVSAARQAVSDAGYPPSTADLRTADRLRQAVDQLDSGDSIGAATGFQQLCHDCDDPIAEGWYKQLLAMATDQHDPVSAQDIQRAAYGLNRMVVRPIAGLVHAKLRPELKDQALAICSQWEGETESQIALGFRARLTDLTFEPGTYREFERAAADLAVLLGWSSSQPDRDTSQGPDVLWAVGEGTYWVIECKNGATVNVVSKHDSDQLSGSMNWFAREYGTTTEAIPVLVHPSHLFDTAAAPPRGTRVVTEDMLESLCEAVRAFAGAAAPYISQGDVKNVARRLTDHDLTPSTLLRAFSRAAASRSH
jgi:hypothetical protein